MREIQWSLAALACFAMMASPCVRPCFADPPLPAVAVPGVAVPAVAVPAGPSAAPGGVAERKAAAVDLSYIPASAVAAAVLHPQQVLTGATAEMLPVEVVTAAGLQYVGFDPTQIQEAIVVIAPPEMPAPAELAPAGPAPSHPAGPREPAGFGAILHFAQAYSRRDVFAKMKPMNPAIKELDGKKFAVVGGPMPVGLFMPDDRTLVIGSDGFLQQMIVAKAVDSKLTQLLKATDCSGTATVVFSLDAVRPLVDQALAHAPPLPPQFADFLKIPKLVSSGVIKLDFRDPSEISATLHTADEKSAEELQALIERGLAMGRQLALANLAQQPQAADPVQQAMQKYEMRMTGRWFEVLKPNRDGSDVKWAVKGMGRPAVYVAVIGVLVSLLLPAVSSARSAARQVQSVNNLKQIAIALLVFESENHHFPARAIFSKDGKPLLSWRVQVLPYLDEGQLYKEFHLDEPWDSPHNKALISRMPAVFANPSAPAIGMTQYLVPVGKGLMFDGDKGTDIAKITAGTGNTIMAVEADKAVVWTKPEDLNVDLGKPLAGLGHARPHGFSAAFADGSVHHLSDSIDPAALKALFTIAGSEAINPGTQR